jgi:hypothetical protein
MEIPQWMTLALIGMLAGISAGLFGIGGGIVVVPALIYWAGFSQHLGTGTTLAMLLPPIGLAAAFEYYRHGNVDVRAAIVLAACMFAGAWAGASLAHQVKGPQLRLAFALFVCAVGLYLVVDATRRIHTP